MAEQQAQLPRVISAELALCVDRVADIGTLEARTEDLPQTASKSAIEAVSQDGSKELFNLVALFTDSKNAMKGIGFFVGGLSLETVGFRLALWLMAGLLTIILISDLLLLPRELFAKSRDVNLLAGVRVFLFGALDVSFVVGLPVFL